LPDEDHVATTLRELRDEVRHGLDSLRKDLADPLAAARSRDEAAAAAWVAVKEFVNSIPGRTVLTAFGLTGAVAFAKWAGVLDPVLQLLPFVAATP